MVFPQTILPIKTELNIGGTWTNITSFVQRRGDEGITITRGKSDENANLTPSSMQLMLNNRDGRFSPRNPMSPYFGLIGRNTPIRCSLLRSSFLQIDADTGTTPVGGAWVSTPDAASLDITGDIDVRFDVDLNSWRESAEFITKWTTAGNQRSYSFFLLDNGRLAFNWSPDGTTVKQWNTSRGLPFVSGRFAVRATLDVDNGAGGSTTNFYYSTTPGLAGPWILYEVPRIDASVTSIFASTAVLGLLDNPNSDRSASTIDGKVYGAEVRSGIGGTVVANPDFTIQTDGATSFADTATPSKTWTLNGAVSLTTRDARFTGEVSAWPQRWDTTGTDVWVPLESAGVLRRLGQGAPDLNSTIRTAFGNAAGMVAYWPLEDGNSSTSGASALTNGPPMKVIAGAADWAADSGFIASNPLMQANNATLLGTVPSYTTTNTIQVQFLLHVPTGGTTNNSILLRLKTSGTLARWDLIYTTGGSLTMTNYDSDGTSPGGGMGATAFAVNGRYVRISLEFTTSGADVAWRCVCQDAAGGITVSTGTVTSRTVRNATSVTLDPTANIADVTIGHVAVTNTVLTTSTTLVNQLAAYTGEAAGRRIERLCREQSVAFTGYGDLDDTVPVGPQLPATFLELLNESALADLGTLGEARDSTALTYIPATARYQKAADITLDYNLFSLADLTPEEDDQAIRNDVTVSRPLGSSARSVLTTGALSVNAPPLGVGRYDTSLEINVATDDQLPDQAGWRVRMGTVDETRYPNIGVNLAHASFTPTQTTAASYVDVGSRIVVTNPPSWIPPDQISQGVQGYTEFLSNYERTLDWNCSPNSPYDQVGFFARTDAVAGDRYSSDGSVLNATMTTTATSVVVSTPSGPLWITTALVPADFPFSIIVAGERMTVTAIVAATATTQTFTVTRSVNGIVKTHVAGETVALFTPAYYTV